MSTKKSAELFDEQLPKIKTSLNAHLFPRKGETSKLPSKTIPGQALSVREIMRRFTNGLPIGNVRIPQYDLDENGEGLDLPDISKWDLADQQEFLLTQRERVKAIRKKLDDQIAEYQESVRREAVEAARKEAKQKEGGGE